MLPSVEQAEEMLTWLKKGKRWRDQDLRVATINIPPVVNGPSIISGNPPKCQECGAVSSTELCAKCTSDKAQVEAMFRAAGVKLP